MPWYRHLLWPFAIVYGIFVWLRNRLFDFGVLPSKEFAVPIICVGNLETGGTGKSPLVNYVVQVLANNGRSVAVLSRGYGRLTKGFRLVSVSSLASEVGDEPLQLKRRLPKVNVAVCENRVQGIEKLLASSQKPDVIVMDDGFQHRWVKPSLSILVTPSRNPFWKNYRFAEQARQPKPTPLAVTPLDGTDEYKRRPLAKVRQLAENCPISVARRKRPFSDTECER